MTVRVSAREAVRILRDAEASGKPVVRGDQAAAGDRRRIRAARTTDLETGATMDSRHEAAVLKRLRARLRAGEIDVLATQVWIRVEGGHVVLDFIAGHVVQLDGVPHLRIEAIDAKPQGGFSTERWRIRRRQLLERYGLSVAEART